jgi:hypothetical protein
MVSSLEHVTKLPAGIAGSILSSNSGYISTPQIHAEWNKKD